MSSADSDPPNYKHGWYSAEQEKCGGAARYARKEGGEAWVTYLTETGVPPSARHVYVGLVDAGTSLGHIPPLVCNHDYWAWHG